MDWKYKYYQQPEILNDNVLRRELTLILAKRETDPKIIALCVDRIVRDTLKREQELADEITEASTKR